jgi:oligopeptide/dipeptide ABC transporter ATP-binding protein
VTEPLLEVRDLHVHFPVYGGVLRHQVATVRAVDGVSFDVGKGEVLGLVGESGSGKTTVGRAVVNLHRATTPGVKLSGAVRLHHDGQVVDVNGLGRRAMLPWRAHVQMIFQDPYSSLNPRLTVAEIVGGPLRLHSSLTRAQRAQRVVELLDKVGMQADHATRYPHEFSGGQRQRIGIARALATRPALVVADEPVSALDVSVQAQVLNLMADLREEFGLTYILVAHDLSVVHHVSDRIAVMYLGNVVELGTADQVYLGPRHPYSRALLSAVPEPNPRRTRAGRMRLQGDIPSPLAKPSGCGFRTRCPIARPECARQVPPLVDTGGGQLVACPFHADLDGRVTAAPGS